MTVRAEVIRRPEIPATVVYIYQHDGRRSSYLSGDTWTDVAEGAQMQPALWLPDDGDAGPALLNALTAFYHGTEDHRALRRDYDAERARVDTLTASVMRIAEKVK